ncbi:ABC transporter substrate-binding protein [Streptomyces sp. 6N223]|uniref:ABC transporter substrate-binding protein n=1 Tax=Streptomyces sp. 6N223 TaxID=3457412 RepID=UPI003FD19A1D
MNTAGWRAIASLAGMLLALAVLTEALWSVPPDARGDTVTVLANWTDGEERAFRKVLEEFEDETGIEVDYQGTRAVHEVLLAQVQSGSPPDVAILSSLGELVEHRERGELFALDENLQDPGVLEAYGEPWIPELAGRRWWVPVRAELKSMIWYDTQRYGATDLPGLTGDDDNWCAGLGSGATSGWTGTDWVEDLLLQQSGPEVYEAWATGRPDSWTSPQMRQAWESWRELLTGAGSDRADEALTTDWNEAAGQLFQQPPGCALNHMGSVSRGEYARVAGSGAPPEPGFLHSARLLPHVPHAWDHTTAWEVSGDFAAMFRKSPEAAELIQFLASPGAQRAWAEEAPDEAAPPLSAHGHVAADPVGDTVTRRLNNTLLREEPRCLDASDAMPPTMRDAFHQAVISFLAPPGEDPTQPDLDALLKQLEEIRGQLKSEETPWLGSVCGSAG